MSTLTPGVRERLERALRGLEHGSIQLVVHDARVVRIERIEHLRLTVTPEAASSTKAGRPTEGSEVCQDG